MLIRLRSLRHCSAKWSNELFANRYQSKFQILLRCCSDIKRNEELLFSSQSGGIVIPSPLRIKQTIKTGFHDLIDGFTCIQTSCPTCPSTTINPNEKTVEQTKSDKCLFINKTTGKLIKFNDIFLF